jgi:hypothetical protein
LKLTTGIIPSKRHLERARMSPGAPFTTRQ